MAHTKASDIVANAFNLLCLSLGVAAVWSILATLRDIAIRNSVQDQMPGLHYLSGWALLWRYFVATALVAGLCWLILVVCANVGPRHLTYQDHLRYELHVRHITGRWMSRGILAGILLGAVVALIYWITGSYAEPLYHDTGSSAMEATILMAIVTIFSFAIVGLMVGIVIATVLAMRTAPPPTGDQH